jgi:hypothetical protein
MGSEAENPLVSALSGFPIGESLRITTSANELSNIKKYNTINVAYLENKMIVKNRNTKIWVPLAEK